MKVHVHHPKAAALRLRVDGDWERDVLPVAVDGGGTRAVFALADGSPFHAFKAVLHQGGTVLWARGGNQLALRDAGQPLEVFPHFDTDARCEVCTRQKPPAVEASGCEVRVLLPPGYDENTLERFPVLYMQDGHNLFFAEEAFGGQTWRVSETVERLAEMALLPRLIVVGVIPAERMLQYTAPGYGPYGRWLVEELKPWVDATYRTRPGAAHTAIMGSSLGGVVSLHAALEHPGVFGAAGCLSSTFGYQDDLFERVARGALPPTRFYLDSGWPADNYEVTRDMVALLRRRGHPPGRLLYLAHPQAKHDEASWAARLHLPLQFFFGEPAVAATAPRSTCPQQMPAFTAAGIF